MKWSAGDKVMALWPGSGLYYHAHINSIDGDRADIVYSDGTEMEISVKSLRSEESFKRRRSKSVTRRRSRSPGRSPSRKSLVVKKSEGSPSRSKSRSTSRGRPRSENKALPRQGSRSRRSVVVSTSTSSSDENKTVVKKMEIREVTIDSRYMVTRQRAKESAVKDEFSSLHRNEPVEHEFGGVFGTSILYLASPIGALLMLLVSTKADWSVSKFNRSMIPCKWEAYLSVKAFAIVLGFLLFHAIIYALPFGHIIKGAASVGGKRLEYKIGARYTLLFTALAYGGLFYLKVPLVQVHNDQFRIAVAATLIAILLNFMVYIASFWVSKEEINPAGDTGSHIYDSFIGRWSHPRIGKLFDLKLYFYRPAMAGWLVVVWVEMHRDYLANGGQHSLPFLLVAVSQIFYILMEFFYDEDQCPFMFDIKDECLGYVQFVGELVVVPFLYSMQVKYLADHPMELKPLNGLVFALLTLFGFVLIIASGRQKSQFRKNPFDHRLAHYTSLPSSRPDGQRLLISGLWGFVRQPHYLGEILVGLSWSILCGFNHLLAWYYPFLITFLLIHRSQRVESRNMRKHGATWKLYRQKVKYRIIPGLY